MEDMKIGLHPKVTVYISCKNYSKFLEQAIESVLRQYYKDWELLLINDGSIDNSLEIMQLYESNPKISIFSTPNIGLPAVANLAINKAKGDYLIRLDGDDYFDESILLTLVNFLEVNPNIAMVFSDYYLIDEGGEIFSHERRSNTSEGKFTKDIPPNGACALTRLKDLREIGGYREDLGAQDGFDLWSRIRYSHNIFNINLPLFYYRRHNSNLTKNFEHINSARLRIKKDANKNIVSDHKPIIAVIPCREKYDILPNFWNAKINSKSLLQRKIESCIKSKLFDKIVVASDTEKVLQTMKDYDEDRLIFFKREADETIRSRSLLQTLTKIASKHDPDYSGIIVTCPYNSPFASTETLEESVHTMIFNSADSCIGVKEIKDMILLRSNRGLRVINENPVFRSDQDMVFQDARIVSATSSSNLKQGMLIGPLNISYTINSKEIFYIDETIKLNLASLIESNNLGNA